MEERRQKNDYSHENQRQLDFLVEHAQDALHRHQENAQIKILKEQKSPAKVVEWAFALDDEVRMSLFCRFAMAVAQGDIEV